MDYFGIALLSGALVGVLCGLVGVLIVLRRRAFFTVALSHATFPGGVLAAILGVNIVLGAGVFGVALVALMVALSRIRRQGSQVAAGVVLSFGYALGMLLLSLNPQLPVRVDAFLAGHILAIPWSNVAIIAATLLVVVLVYALFGKELLFSSFDRRGYRAAGYREALTDAVALTIITVAVVAVMPAVGSILAIAMFAAPAAAARLVTRRILPMLLLSCGFGVAAALLGLLASRYLSLAAGGAIAVTAAALAVLVLLLRLLAGRLRGAAPPSAAAGKPPTVGLQEAKR